MNWLEVCVCCVRVLIELKKRGGKGRKDWVFEINESMHNNLKYEYQNYDIYNEMV